MRGLLQDRVRDLIGVSLSGLGRALEVLHRRRIERFRRTQDSLRERYGIRDDTPIREYGPELRAAIEAWATGRKDVRFAETSGSTAEPKRIAFTRSRVRMTKWVYIDVFARAYAALPIARKSLYVFSALGGDSSLTAMLTEEARLPPYLSTLQAPYRAHAHPAMRALLQDHSPSAVRLLVLAASDPGVLYATNPSTLSAFLEALADDWDRTRALVKLAVEAPDRLDPEVQRILRRLESIGARERFLAIARSSTPLPLSACAPRVEAYVCWTGGYVAPFLERVERHLPPARYRRIPMYSMSTETIETVASFEPEQIAFLPLAPGVLYELLPEDAPDDPRHLVRPEDAEAGGLYTLVVSDAYGLIRYQTGDLFRVRGKVHGLPDLHFERRRGLAYSFTGEKLTGTQVSEALSKLGVERTAALVPSTDGCLPHYSLVVFGGVEVDAGRMDTILSELNSEYAAKRRTGRLGPIDVVRTDLASFARRMGGAGWESQFKFLPLYTRTLERS